jgi:hypothetical protein
MSPRAVATCSPTAKNTVMRIAATSSNIAEFSLRGSALVI